MTRLSQLCVSTNALKALADLLGDMPINQVTGLFPEDGELKGSDAVLYLRATIAVHGSTQTDDALVVQCNRCGALKSPDAFSLVVIKGGFFYSTCNICLIADGGSRVPLTYPCPHYYFSIGRGRRLVCISCGASAQYTPEQFELILLGLEVEIPNRLLRY